MCRPRAPSLTLQPMCAVLSWQLSVLDNRCKSIVDAEVTVVGLLAQDFLNGVCTHTIWLTEKVLTYYTGELPATLLVCTALKRCPSGFGPGCCAA